MIVYGESDLDENRELRVGWGLFRDRRPEMYAKEFLTFDAEYGMI